MRTIAWSSDAAHRLSRSKPEAARASRPAASAPGAGRSRPSSTAHQPPSSSTGISALHSRFIGRDSSGM